MQKDLAYLIDNTSLIKLEARILMAHILKKYFSLPPSAIISKSNILLSPNAFDEWKNLVTRRKRGEPIAYLLGKKGFHAIELEVNSAVLIPRPETELLVEIVLNEIKLLEKKFAAPKILDLGTGSGAIALAIANHASRTLVTATDKSAEALAIAKLNAKCLELETRVEFFKGNWYEAIPKNTIFDVIVSNPPYIKAQDPHLFQGDLRFEPLDALTDHSNGLSCLETIIFGANKYLKPNGLLSVEHGYDQSGTVAKLMESAGFRNIETLPDLAGHPRVTSGRK